MNNYKVSSIASPVITLIRPNQYLLIHKIYASVEYAVLGDGNNFKILAYGTDDINYTLMYFLTHESKFYIHDVSVDFLCKQGTIPIVSLDGGATDYVVNLVYNILNEDEVSRDMDETVIKKCDLWKFITQGCEF